MNKQQSFVVIGFLLLLVIICILTFCNVRFLVKDKKQTNIEEVNYDCIFNKSDFYYPYFKEYFINKHPNCLSVSNEGNMYYLEMNDNVIVYEVISIKSERKKEYFKTNYRYITTKRRIFDSVYVEIPAKNNTLLLEPFDYVEYISNDIIKYLKRRYEYNDIYIKHNNCRYFYCISIIENNEEIITIEVKYYIKVITCIVSNKQIISINHEQTNIISITKK